MSPEFTRPLALFTQWECGERKIPAGGWAWGGAARGGLRVEMAGAELLGFTVEAGRGSHRVFKRRGESIQLNFQERDGYIPPYQARQLIAMIRKYGGEDE